MSLSTTKPFVSPNKPSRETPPPHAGFDLSDQISAEESSPQLERGRKRRRSSAAYNTTQLPSATLRGRGRRRSSSLNPYTVTSSHRSASPERNLDAQLSKQKEAGKKSLRPGRKEVEKPSGREVMPGQQQQQQQQQHQQQHTHKKRRSQSPSRSRSFDHEGDPKPRRRQRTRSRSRSHGHGKENIKIGRVKGLFSSKLNERDEDIAVED